MTDFSAHNEEVRKVWAAYEARRPYRVPVIYSLNERMIMLVPELNPKGITPRQYMENPQIHWESQMEFHKWVRFNIYQDAEMGLPAEWGCGVSLFNVYEAAWFGCELFYPPNDIPDTIPMFQNKKELLYESVLPDPLRGNIMGRALELAEYMEMKRLGGYMGRPIARPWMPTLITDGPLTVACNLRGSTEVCEDILEDEKYFHDLMKWVTRGIILRCRAWMAYAGQKDPGPDDVFSFADDAIALLSPAQYREHVLPYHRQIVDEFHPNGRNSIHLCGSAQHQFPVLVNELNVHKFEVGFPTDMGRQRGILGPDVEFVGNIHPELLRKGPVSDIENAVRDVCRSGVMEGGRFILADGNNCSPGTPELHFSAMYNAGIEYGKYPGV